MSPPRPPLDPDAVRSQLVTPGGFWRAIEIVARTGSTNADLTGAARAGAGEGLALVAEHQYAGRGRAGRRWSSPPGAGIAVSALLRPAAAPAARWGWLPLLAGVATAEAIEATTGLVAQLKWPNDVLVGEGKCAGVLAEVVEAAVVVGVGLNVTTTVAELPPAPPEALPATSLVVAGARAPDRGVLLVELLRRLGSWYAAWVAAAGDADRCGLRPAYLAASATAGRLVRAQLPGGAQLTGEAVAVDSEGRLLVRDPAGGEHLLAAGDVTHLRGGEPAQGRWPAQHG